MLHQGGRPSELVFDAPSTLVWLIVPQLSCPHRCQGDLKNSLDTADSIAVVLVEMHFQVRVVCKQVLLTAYLAWAAKHEFNSQQGPSNTSSGEGQKPLQHIPPFHEHLLDALQLRGLGDTNPLAGQRLHCWARISLPWPAAQL